MGLCNYSSFYFYECSQSGPWTWITQLLHPKRNRSKHCSPGVIKFMRLQSGIKDAWVFSDLQSFPFEREDQGRFFKLQLFQDIPATNIGLSTQNTLRRSGEVIFQSNTFDYFTVSDPGENPVPSKGVGHTSAYNYDAQGIVYLFQAGRFGFKTVTDPVLMQQIPISLAHILQVPRPSASSINIAPLPHVNPNRR